MASNEELAKAFADLTQSVKSTQDELMMLKQHGPTQAGIDLSISSGLQYSGTVASDSPPPNKKYKTEDGEDTDEDMDDPEDTDLVTLSEKAATFLKAAFGSKLENKTTKAKVKAQGTPNSQWIRCAKIDPVVFVNVSPAARTADRAASRLQQF